MIYFDAAATTLQKPPQVRKMAAYAMEHYASPGRGGYRASMLASDAVYDCRKELAELFEAKPEDIVFTMNATHALNLAIKTLVSPGDEVVISGFEHNAVWRPLVQIGANVKLAGRKLFDPDDTLEAFRTAIGPETKAVVCTHVSNVFGYVLPIEKIAALCHERGVPLVVDCSQSAGILPVSLGKLHAAFLCMPGHKSLYGPQGTGVLVCGHALRPLLAGGTGSLSKSASMPEFTPDAGEAGTHNVPGICALCEGVRFVKNVGLDAICAHGKMLGQLLTAELANLPGVRVYHGRNQAGVVSFLLETGGRGANCGKAFIGRASRFGRGFTARRWRTSLPGRFLPARFAQASLFSTPRVRCAHWRRVLISVKRFHFFRAAPCYCALDLEYNHNNYKYQQEWRL